MPQYSDTLVFHSYSDLEAEVSAQGSWSALTSFVISGVLVEQHPGNSLYYVKEYVGEANIPGDVKRLRRSVFQLMQRMGQPVIVKHMFNDHDARVGTAQSSPSVVNSSNLEAYGNQVRNRDPFSYGTGYCSIQLSTNEWINPNSGAITTSDTSPGQGYILAPFYRGYGPGFLTYIIEPDAPIDIFKLTSSGMLTKVQSQIVVAPWFPEINDNDLLINVELVNGLVTNTHERYQARRTAPISIRGQDRKGRREYSADHGNRFVVNQNFEATMVPELSVLYQVETDR